MKRLIKLVVIVAVIVAGITFVINYINRYSTEKLNSFSIVRDGKEVVVYKDGKVNGKSVEINNTIDKVLSNSMIPYVIKQSKKAENIASPKWLIIMNYDEEIYTVGGNDTEPKFISDIIEYFKK